MNTAPGLPSTINDGCPVLTIGGITVDSGGTPTAATTLAGTPVTSRMTTAAAGPGEGPGSEPGPGTVTCRSGLVTEPAEAYRVTAPARPTAPITSAARARPRPTVCPDDDRIFDRATALRTRATTEPRPPTHKMARTRAAMARPLVTGAARETVHGAVP